MKDTTRTTADVFDDHSDGYSSTVDQAVAFTGLGVDFFTRVKAGYITDICDDHFGDAATVDALDVGCGNGNFHPLLAPAFRSLSGVDISETSIEAASRRSPEVGCQVYDGETLPYGDGEFDLAFTICVMHHVPEAQWPQFASEMHRVVRPGGLALVFEHNPQNPLTMRAVDNCPFDEDAVLLRSSRTTALMRDAGFSDIDARFILSVPAGNALLRKVDRLFSRVPFGAQYYVRAAKD